ncbi:MAG: type transporter [Myxococcaceae bacterium]|nr:type transporter [Myxococcaceae bacterium]
MSAFWVLTRLRLAEVLRSRSSTAFMLGFPLILLLVVGAVFQRGHPFERRHVALCMDSLDAALENELARTFKGVEEVRFDRVDRCTSALGMLKSRIVSAALHRERAQLVLTVGPRDRLFGLGFAASSGRPLQIEVLEVAAHGYVQFLFPGLLTFSVLLSGLFGMGHAMVRYRESLFLKKLATTQLSRLTFVSSQIVSRTLLVLVQSALLVAGARLFFGVPLGAAALGWLSVITVLGLLTFMGAGFVLACVVTKEALMVDVISALNLPLIFLSELFFLLDELPRPLALLGNWLPTTHMVRLLREVLLYGTNDVGALMPGLLVLAAWTVLGFAVSLSAFRWS